MPMHGFSFGALGRRMRSLERGGRRGGARLVETPLGGIVLTGATMACGIPIVGYCRCNIVKEKGRSGSFWLNSRIGFGIDAKGEIWR